MVMHKLYAPTRRGSVCPSSPRQAHNIFTKSEPYALHLHAPKHGPRTHPRYISVRSPEPSYVPQLPSIPSAMWMRHLIVTMVPVHPNTTLCTVETKHVPEQQQMNVSNQNTPILGPRRTTCQTWGSHVRTQARITNIGTQRRSE